MKLTTLVSGGTAMALAATISLVSVPLAHADQTTPGSYNTVNPHRLLDTRSGLGAPMAAVAAHATLTFTATDASEGFVGAVALNITAVSPTAPGSLTVFAAGNTRPYASNLNFQADQNVPNMVITAVSAGLNAGKVSIYNGSAGTVQLLADIHGYFTGGRNTGVPGTFVALPSSKRVLDTRKGIGAAKARVAPRSGLTLRVAGIDGVPADASAVVANVTAAQGDNRGYVTAYEGAPRPLASNLNYEMKQDRANLALVPVASNGTISLFNGATFGSVDLVVDITGYFVGGDPAADGAFIPSTPYRVFDSRNPGGAPAGALTTSKIRIFPANDPTFAFFKAVVVNVTAVQPEAAGYLTTYNGVGPLPSVSSANFVPKHDVAGAVILPVNRDGTISIYNGSYGNVDLVVDVTGFFFAQPAPQAAGVARAAAIPAGQRITAALAAMKKFSATPHPTPVSISHTK
ncbi:MAG: hypothetical protein M3Z00_06390 [Actinomycetota bacterium]|nr:hypothetical protein [Actinomycetota bacterium]